MTELGDRLTGAKLIIDALSDEKIDAEQAERLLDGLIPPQNQPQTLVSPERPLESPLTALDALDDAEYQEQRSIPRDERQDAIDEELSTEEQSVEQRLREGFRSLRDRHELDMERQPTHPLVEERAGELLDEMERVLGLTPR